ncbi:hypothetical protein [Terrarubrum flagellatum]|uniref:hypothetical protein n=1 Tax=Terrirubrum flagellatum TaxID=2895980 RepID=UPI003144F050
MLRFAALASAVLVSGAAFAADLPSRKGAPVPPPSAACLEKNALPIDVFGFQVGTDTNDYQALSASVQYNGFYGTRFGDFNGHQIIGQVSYGILPCMEIGPYLTGGWVKNGGLGGIGNGSYFGGGLEAKYKFLGRDTHGLGATFDIIVQGVGNDGAFYAPTKSTWDVIPSLFLDKELISGKLYGAINVAYDFNFRNKVIAGIGDATDTGVLRLGAALSYQLVEGFFIGADINHFRRYKGFFGDEFGYATTLGPNFYWQATPKLAVTAAYNVQVAGKTTGGPALSGGDLDIVNFNQHLLKVKFAYSF